MPDRRCLELLLVEDENLVRLTVSLMLEEDHDFHVVEAATGEHALRLVEDGLRADVLVTDIDLGPGINGFSLAERVRTLRPGLPVVFVTGRPPTLQDRPPRAGEAYLVKPFAVTVLVRLVRGLVAA